MKQAYYLGWFLAILSFVSGGAEIVATARLDGHHVLLSTRETWYTLWPGSWVRTGVWFQNIGVPWLWVDVIKPVLGIIPAWLIFGVPAAFLIIRFRPPKPLSDDEPSDIIGVYQELAARAREDETFDPREDDMAPTHFEPDPAGFEPSDHLVKSRQPDFNTWDDVDWADPSDEQYVHMRFDDLEPEKKEPEGETKPSSPDGPDRNGPVS